MHKVVRISKKYAMPCAATSITNSSMLLARGIFYKMVLNFTIGKVGRTHYCNAYCGRILLRGQDRIETFSNRYCLVCGHKLIKETIKMLERNLKEIEKTHLKEIVAMRMKG